MDELAAPSCESDPPGGPDRFFLKSGYRERADVETVVPTPRTGQLPDGDVYALALHFSKCHEARAVIDLTYEMACGLSQLSPDELARQMDPGILGRSIVVCTEVLEKMLDPLPLLRVFSAFLEHVPVMLVTTPERDLLRGPEHLGPPPNNTTVREWNMDEFRSLLEWSDLPVAFMGLAATNDRQPEKHSALAVLDPANTPPLRPARDGFRVVAIIFCRNESDIIESTVQYLIDQDVDPYIIDNWSDDGTWELLKEIEGDLAGLERFPSDGDSGLFDLHRILTRVEQIALDIDAQWCFLHAADERIVSPWPSTRLKDAVFHVDAAGFNAIDLTLINFRPVDDAFEPGTDPEKHLRHYAFGTSPASFVQVRGWKRPGRTPIQLAQTAGHQVLFPGRRVFPYKFLLKHYPVRSQRHGENKILRERHPRWDPKARARGWHVQYDHIDEKHSFLHDPETLSLFDREHFSIEYLTERLSGVGVARMGPSPKA